MKIDKRKIEFLVWIISLLFLAVICIVAICNAAADDEEAESTIRYTGYPSIRYNPENLSDFSESSKNEDSQPADQEPAVQDGKSDDTHGKLPSRYRRYECEKLWPDVPLAGDIQRIIAKDCEQLGIDPALVIAFIATESHFKERAISKTKDYGLCQINIKNHANLSKKYGVTDFLDGVQNAHCGCHIIAYLYKRCGKDINKTAMAYNMGYGGMCKAIREGRESTAYSRKIEGMYEEWKEKID